MRRGLLGWLGLLGVVSLASYTVAVLVAPSAYPGYDWMAQAVSDLSADAAPSRQLWRVLAAPYDFCSVAGATCAAVFVSERQPASRKLRVGVYLFCLMRWLSAVGYTAFPLQDAGSALGGFQEFMHVFVVTSGVVLLSVASLACIALAGRKVPETRALAGCAALALAMMCGGAIGQGGRSAEPLRRGGAPERLRRRGL